MILLVSQNIICWPKICQGAVHKQRQHMGGPEGSKIGPNYWWLVLKTVKHGGGRLLKILKNCWRCLWMVPKLYQQIIFQNDCNQMKNWLIFFLKFKANKWKWHSSMVVSTFEPVLSSTHKYGSFKWLLVLILLYFSCSIPIFRVNKIDC